MGQATSTMTTETSIMVGEATGTEQPTVPVAADVNVSDADIAFIREAASVGTSEADQGDTTAVQAHRTTRTGGHSDGARRRDASAFVLTFNESTTMASQADLDAALASVPDPAAVTSLSIGFSHKRPIANASLLDKHDMIPDEIAEAVYEDHVTNAYRLAALSTFTALRSINIHTDDGCPHPIFVSIPRSVWSALEVVTGDWTTFAVLDS
ncbi:hypothetical protein pdul_cds_166 [Pandoravirus dulcis]|uniref:Uncharacterized protein n=1 Tax=Pandoravirus dulcis TaxID=1349409 RepID=S4VRR6_9VIRU|nr:hypothetical protein pdul_cds_166 [Pandoravirus dulcis]AGO82090.2 hypothetical protein pdul_cds_166 [Pandoravirus dulcis]